MSDAFTDHLPVADPDRGVARAAWARRVIMTLLALLPVAALIALERDQRVHAVGAHVFAIAERDHLGDSAGHGW